MNLDEFTKLVAVLYLFLGGALTAVFAFSQVRNKNNADAIESLTSSVVNLNTELSKLKLQYNADMIAKDTEIFRLKQKIEKLESEVEGRQHRG